MPKPKTYIPNRDQLEKRIEILNSMMKKIGSYKGVAIIYAEKTKKDRKDSYQMCYNILVAKSFSSYREADLVIRCAKIYLLERIALVEEAAKTNRKMLAKV